jgi:hypothetical protein
MFSFRYQMGDGGRSVADNGHRKGSVLASQADSFARFVKKWTLKLAKAVGTRFMDATAVYRRPANLDTFAQPGVEPRCALATVY